MSLIVTANHLLNNMVSQNQPCSVRTFTATTTQNTIYRIQGL